MARLTEFIRGVEAAGEEAHARGLRAALGAGEARWAAEAAESARLATSPRRAEEGTTEMAGVERSGPFGMFSKATLKDSAKVGRGRWRGGGANWVSGGGGVVARG